MRDEIRIGWCVNKHLNEEADAAFFVLDPHQIAMLIEMCRVATDRCRAF